MFISTSELERHFGNQARVALNSVQQIAEEVEYGDLKARIDATLE
jgi:hypothetical protein